MTTQTTLAQLHAVTCPTCGATPGTSCTFTRNRPGGARTGDTMGEACHSGRYTAAQAAR